MSQLKILIANQSYVSAKSLLEAEIKSQNGRVNTQLYILYLCLAAIDSPWRLPGESRLQNTRYKWLLLEIRHRVFGHVFPSFILSVDGPSLCQFLPDAWTKEEGSIWSVLDDSLTSIGLSKSFSPSVSTYAELVVLSHSNVLDETRSRIIQEWHDFHSVKAFYDWLDISAFPQKAGVRESIDQAKSVTRFSEAQVGYLMDAYRENKIDLYGVQSSVAFCAAALESVRDFKKFVHNAPRSRVFTVAEIIKRCNFDELLLELFNSVGKPEWLLVKVLITSAYTRGYNNPAVQSLARMRAESLRKLALKNTKGIKVTPRKRSTGMNIVLMTADLGHHAVSYFLSSIFMRYQLYDISLTLLVCCKTDGNTAINRIRTFANLASKCFDVYGKTSSEIGRLIKSVKPDLILEMNGLLGGSRLDGVPLQRDIPVVHYLGGQCSNYGLANTLLVDDELNKNGCLDDQFQEKLVSLNDWMCYNPSAFMEFKYESLVQPRPSAYEKFFVVGYFNTLLKCGPRTRSVMASILSEIPNSVLLLGHASNSSYHYNRLIKELQINTPERVIFDIRVVSWQDHIKRIAICDVVLDNLDHISGGTTTCDALAVGTPIVSTLSRRDTFASRMTLSILRSTNLQEMATEQLPSPDDLLRISDAYKERLMLINHVRESRLCDLDLHSESLFTKLKYEVGKS